MVQVIRWLPDGLLKGLLAFESLKLLMAMKPSSGWWELVGARGSEHSLETRGSTGAAPRSARESPNGSLG